MAGAVGSGSASPDSPDDPQSPDRELADDAALPAVSGGVPPPVLVPGSAASLPDGGQGLPVSRQNLSAASGQPVLSYEKAGGVVVVGGAQTAHSLHTAAAEVPGEEVPQTRIADIRPTAGAGVQPLQQSMGSAPVNALPPATGKEALASEIAPPVDPDLLVAAGTEPSARAAQQAERTAPVSANRKVPVVASTVPNVAIDRSDAPASGLEATAGESSVAGPVELEGGETATGYLSRGTPGPELTAIPAPASGSSGSVAGSLLADATSILSASETGAADSVVSADRSGREQSAWMQQVFDRVAAMAAGSAPRADMRLSPEHLGDLEIQVRAGDGHAHITFIASEQAVKDALTGNLDRLRTLLQESGYQRVDVQVETGSRGGSPQQRQEGLPRYESARHSVDNDVSVNDSMPANGFRPAPGGLLNLYA